ncbi:AarF domain-containing protein [Drosera capensis]
MWRTLKFTTKLSVYTLTAAGVGAGAVSLTGDRFQYLSNLPDEPRVGLSGLVRSSRAVFTIAVNVVDYKYSLYGLVEDSDEYRRELSEVHLRSAKRVLKLCETNKGFYVKAGQFVAAPRQVPKEYSSTLSSLQDQAVPCPFKFIREVLTSNLKKDLNEIFISFDEEPIAAASIAQVHHAVLQNHEEVAVKVQYPGLKQLMRVDIAAMSFLSKAVTLLFPDYRFGWILSAFKDAIAMELDFIQEARNSERTAKNFETNKRVKVPRVLWDWTTEQVLTMQFCTGNKIDDVEYLKKAGVDPIQVAKLLSEVFASMVFIHGFVHGDPHPGNILISIELKQGFTIVLLDHGIYKELDEDFRLDYCQLWRALILRNVNEIQQVGERFGIGKYFRYLPLIFTGTTIDSKSALGKGMSTEERQMVKQELKSLKMEDFSSFMESLPPDLLTILRTDGLLRSILSKLGAARHIRLLAYSKHAVDGLSMRRTAGSGFLELVYLMEDVKHIVVGKLKHLFLRAARLLHLFS